MSGGKKSKVSFCFWSSVPAQFCLDLVLGGEVCLIPLFWLVSPQEPPDSGHCLTGQCADSSISSIQRILNKNVADRKGSVHSSGK